MSRAGLYQKYAILFVDDEEISRKYFGRAFGVDFRVLLAPSADAALELLERRDAEVGLLVTDQRMPGRSGSSLLAEVRQRFPGIVRILTTAYASLDDAIAAVNQGEVFRYLTKPWDLAKVQQALRDGLDLFLTQQHERELLSARRQTMYSLAASVAHEMRTPLASIGSAVGGIRRYLPSLLEVYDRAEAEGWSLPPIREAHRRVLASATDSIDHTLRQAHAVIDLLLMNAGDRPGARGQYQLHSMRGCVREALDSYPFSASQRDRVRLVDGPDFTFAGADALMVYVFYNLFRNALYAVEAAGQGEVTVSVEPGDAENQVRVRDTGTGIPGEQLPRIFDEFYSNKHGTAGTGMGLAFCRRVMKSFGGHIECDSEEGRYTEFLLRLPRPEGHP